MNIAGREIGPNQPPYIVAEISCNHSGDINRAFDLIDAAWSAGADAVKIQTYDPADLTKPDNPLWNLYEKAKTPRDWHGKIFAHAKKVGITLFSSPFSVDAVAFLELFKPPAYKIASMEIKRADLIAAVLETGKPIIVSTGMANESDLLQFVGTPEGGVRHAVLLHCVSQYPSKIEDANLRAIGTLADYNLSGLSDHTPGYETAIAATALGAVMIEKHIKLDDNCIDAKYSLDPSQFTQMCVAVKSIWEGMGDGKIKPTCEPRMR